jgi:thiamine biosynthesis lipoprotein
VATSGTYVRGNHIYNAKAYDQRMDEIVSLTVIGPNIYEADRFATAAFAMGKSGISFIEKLPRFESYQIDNKGIATFTSGFEKFVLKK